MINSSKPTDSTESVVTIAIFGSGIAAYMTAIALAKSLPSRFEIILVNDESIESNDAFYGHVCSPTSYSFHLRLGLSEPDLMMHSDTAFSYGTHYRQWCQSDLSWVQCYHQSLAIQDGVEFQQCLFRAGLTELEPYLVSAQAALKGRFAHPPNDPKVPLSRAEYGYHISTDKYLNVLKHTLEPYTQTSVRLLSANLLDVVYKNQDTDENQIIDHVVINGDKDDANKIHADWFIDCTGPKAALACGLGNGVNVLREIDYCASKLSTDQPLSSARTLDSFEFGWQANTPVRGHVERLTVFNAENQKTALKTHGEPQEFGQCPIGRRDSAWHGNCIAIGQAAAIIEPLTPAPFILLQADIERLLELIPVSSNAALECQEYNRRFQLDFDHASLFNQSMYCHDRLPSTAFWQAAAQIPMDEKLQIKLTQFKSRAVISMFDLEPFSKQDWLIQHVGLQRKSERYSRFADRFSVKDLNQWFAQQAMDINNITDKMPPHERYVKRMLDYVRSQT